MPNQPFGGFPLGPLLQFFGIEDEKRLMRLALFLLVHAMIDRHLVYLSAIREYPKRISPCMRRAETADQHVDPADVPTFEELIAEHAKGTFGVHLSRVRERGLVGEEYLRICDEINRGRVHFLHWEPGRFEVPRYNRLDVTTLEGLRTLIGEARRVLEAIMEAIQWTPPDHVT